MWFRNELSSFAEVSLCMGNGSDVCLDQTQVSLHRHGGHFVLLKCPSWLSASWHALFPCDRAVGVFLINLSFAVRCKCHDHHTHTQPHSVTVQYTTLIRDVQYSDIWKIKALFESSQPSPACPYKNMVHCHFFLHKSHMDRPGIESRDIKLTWIIFKDVVRTAQ